ncbi:MAG TPA: hypothetical protein VIK01_04820, partial [Polyangiaceae bacterium]
MARLRFAARASVLAVVLGCVPVTARAATPNAKPAKAASKPKASKPDRAKAALKPAESGELTKSAEPAKAPLDTGKPVESAPDPQRGVGTRSVGALPGVTASE